MRVGVGLALSRSKLGRGLGLTLGALAPTPTPPPTGPDPTPTLAALSGFTFADPAAYPPTPRVLTGMAPQSGSWLEIQLATGATNWAMTNPTSFYIDLTDANQQAAYDVVSGLAAYTSGVTWGRARWGQGPKTAPTAFSPWTGVASHGDLTAPVLTMSSVTIPEYDANGAPNKMRLLVQMDKPGTIRPTGTTGTRCEIAGAFPEFTVRLLGDADLDRETVPTHAIDLIAVSTAGVESARYSTTVTVGDVDEVPGAVDFGDTLEAPRSTTLQSAEVTITGIPAGIVLPVTITSAAGRFRVGTSGAYDRAPKMVQLGSKLRLELDTSAAYSAATPVQVKISDTVLTWNVQTLPDASGFVYLSAAENTSKIDAASGAIPGVTLKQGPNLLVLSGLHTPLTGIRLSNASGTLGQVINGSYATADGTQSCAMAVVTAPADGVYPIWISGAYHIWAHILSFAFPPGFSTTPNDVAVRRTNYLSSGYNAFNDRDANVSGDEADVQVAVSTGGCGIYAACAHSIGTDGFPVAPNGGGVQIAQAYTDFDGATSTTLGSLPLDSFVRVYQFRDSLTPGFTGGTQNGQFGGGVAASFNAS